IQSNGILGHSASGQILVNEGTLRKSAGGGTSEMRMRLDNIGTVEVETGTLAFVRGGNSTGSFWVDAGATLELQTHDDQVPHAITPDPSSSLAGDGRLLLSGRSVRLAGSGLVDVQTLELTGGGGSSAGRLQLDRDAAIPEVLLHGKLAGSGALTVSESLLWT